MSVLSLLMIPATTLFMGAQWLGHSSAKPGVMGLILHRAGIDLGLQPKLGTKKRSWGK